jgi:hypothetical protein
VSAELLPTRVRPNETAAHSRDGSIPAEYGPATSTRSHDGTVTSVTSTDARAHYYALIYHDDHDYPDKASPRYNDYNHT